MKIHDAFKLRLYELCKCKKIKFKTLCKNCKIKSNKVFKEGFGINIFMLKILCNGLKITTKYFFNSSYFNNMEF